MQEVKRQAMLELHKAVTAAESKANEMIVSERAKMDRAISDARKQTREELLGTFNHQEESSEVSISLVLHLSSVLMFSPTSTFLNKCISLVLHRQFSFSRPPLHS